ncbi:MAG: hypothetical protein CMJ78_22505 [Planctomycetaceae bacterium]|nr:hypothetical protein [Planctomycetaceae bacterium]
MASKSLEVRPNMPFKVKHKLGEGDPIDNGSIEVRPQKGRTRFLVRYTTANAQGGRKIKQVRTIAC